MEPMANRPTTGNRPTKADRKEQARRERVELQRKIARTRRNRRIAIVLVGVVVVAVAAFALTRPSTAVADPAELLEQAATASTAAGCGPVEDVGAYQPEQQDDAHVATQDMPPLSTYPSVPPASGPHNEVPLAAGVYSTPPSIDRVLHSLEHGGVVIWHAPGAAGPELDELRAFYEEPEFGSRVIVAPYDYPDQGDAGRLPAGTQMAFTAWHHASTCAQVSLPAAFGFSSRWAAPPYGDETYLGDAPEAGAAF
jgi:hypothetical protein